MVNVDGISEGCNTICEGSIVESLVPVVGNGVCVAGDTGGACDVHPAKKTERMIKTRMNTGAMDCLFMDSIHPVPRKTFVVFASDWHFVKTKILME